MSPSAKHSVINIFSPNIYSDMFNFYLAAGKSIDATQEMLAIGICNIGNSFVQAFPGTGALARSAVNNASGVRTPLGGLYTGKTNL